MSWFDIYQQRISVNGRNEADEFKNATIAFIESSFENATNYKEVSIGNKNIGIRLIKSKEKRGVEKKKDVLFKPRTNLDVGTILIIDGQHWILMSFDYDDVSPRGAIQLCNKNLNWNDGTILQSVPCIATSLQYIRYSVMPDKLDVNTIVGGIYIFAPYNEETKGIKISTRIILGNQAYEIIGIDDMTNVSNNTGVIQFATRMDIKKEGDDFVNEIANNKHIYGGKSNSTNQDESSDDQAW